MDKKALLDAAVSAAVALKLDYLNEEFDPDVAVNADEAMQDLVEETRDGTLSEQAINLISAASHAMQAALDEDGTSEMANIAALCLAEVAKTACL